jgi:hypothetical protein
MAGNLVEVLPNKNKPRNVNDPFMKIVEEELKKGSPTRLAQAVTTAPPATAALAAQILSTFKGGWAKVTSIFEKSDEDRLMEIAYAAVYGRAPLTWKEKALKKIMEILELGKKGLTGVAGVLSAASAVFSLERLKTLLKGSRLQLITSRYDAGGAKIPGMSARSAPRMFLTSRYSPMKMPSLQNIRGKAVEDVVKEAEGASGAKPTPEAMAVRISKKLTGLAPAEILKRLKAGTLTMPPARVSGTRYNLQTLEASELTNLAGKLGMTQRDILDNPQAAAILARRLRAPGAKMTNENAKALYAELVSLSTPFQRTTKTRYSPVKFTLPAGRVGRRGPAPVSEAEKNIDKNKNMNAFISTLIEGTGTTPKNFEINGKKYSLKPGEHGGVISVPASLKPELEKKLRAETIQGAINLAKRYRGMSTNTNRELAILGISQRNISNYTPTDDLMRIRERYFNRMSEPLREKLIRAIESKARRDATALRSLTLNSARLRSWARHLGTFKNEPYRSDFVTALRNGIQKTADERNTNTALRRLRQLRANASGLNVNANIAGAERQIMERMRREQNNKRRLLNANRASRGLAPLSRGIPYYPNQPRPSGFGNLRPTFEAPPNQPQFGAVPRPMPQIPPMPIMANAGRQAPPIENVLPPAEATAVLNAGGANKALNLVENAGGVTNVVKTANILKSVGNNPNAAVAAGANAKNVKIVLQLGGANNALKVANAVPKLKKRRRSKAKKAEPKPKPPRVKEIKKLIEYLGSKENLVKKLPNKENKEKKLTKKQIVSKITRHLLRKN